MTRNKSNKGKKDTESNLKTAKNDEIQLIIM